MTKSNFTLRDALSRYTSSGGFATTFPSEGKANVRFCFPEIPLLLPHVLCGDGFGDRQTEFGADF